MKITVTIVLVLRYLPFFHIIHSIFKLFSENEVFIFLKITLIGNITLNQTLHRNHNNTGETENQKEINKNVLLFI
jgi:hypothetical protein